MDQEAAGAGELVGLLGHHPDGEFFIEEVRTGELVGLHGVGLVDISGGGRRVDPAAREFVQGRILGLHGCATRSVIVNGHGRAFRSVRGGLIPAYRLG